MLTYILLSHFIWRSLFSALHPIPITDCVTGDSVDSFLSFPLIKASIAWGDASLCALLQAVRNDNIQTVPWVYFLQKDYIKLQPYTCSLIHWSFRNIKWEETTVTVFIECRSFAWLHCGTIRGAEISTNRTEALACFMSVKKKKKFYILRIIEQRRCIIHDNDKIINSSILPNLPCVSQIIQSYIPNWQYQWILFL